MDRQEYAKWVEYVSKNDIGLPRVIYEDYDDWMKKLTLARFLAGRMCKQYIPALKLMETILKENLTEFNEDDDNRYEDFIEHKIWTLKDIGRLYWVIEEDAVKALSYLEKSLELAESVDYDLSFMVRGEIWDEKLYLLMKVEGEEIVLQDIQNKIQYHESNNVHETNSYLFYGYYAMSTIEGEKGNWEAATNQLKKALEYFPLEDWDNVELDEIWESKKIDLESKYEQMEKLTFRTVAWDI